MARYHRGCTQRRIITIESASWFQSSGNNASVYRLEISIINNLFVHVKTKPDTKTEDREGPTDNPRAMYKLINNFFSKKQWHEYVRTVTNTKTKILTKFQDFKKLVKKTSFSIFLKLFLILSFWCKPDYKLSTSLIDSVTTLNRHRPPCKRTSPRSVRWVALTSSHLLSGVFFCYF